MPEQEPQYFKEFRKHIDIKFADVEKKIEVTVEKAVDDLALITAKNFDLVNKDIRIMKDDIIEIQKTMATKDDIAQIRSVMATKDDIKNMATKDDIKELDAHIGKYERRLQPMEEIVLKDHRVRIRALEKEVWA